MKTDLISDDLKLIPLFLIQFIDVEREACGTEAYKEYEQILSIHGLSSRDFCLSLNLEQLLLS